MVGREVMVPAEINRIVAHRSGMLRFLIWMDADDLVCAIEQSEQRRRVPYIYAREELRELPVIGSGNLIDPERLAVIAPDVIFVTYMTAEEADRLQQQTRIAVLVVNYGNFDDEIDVVFDAMRFLGLLLNREDRADEVITFIQNTISDLQGRVSGIADQQRPEAYIGGVAYRGAQGITSTEPRYPSFRFLGIDNIAESLGSSMASAGDLRINAFIDKEQLITWNPQYLFLDMASPISHESQLRGEPWLMVLDAVKNNRVYTVYPYNWNTTNYSTILVNSYFMGKFLFPAQFADVDPVEKADEIYTAILGRPVFDRLVEQYGESRQLFVND